MTAPGDDNDDQFPPDADPPQFNLFGKSDQMKIPTLYLKDQSKDMRILIIKQEITLHLHKIPFKKSMSKNQIRRKCTEKGFQT